MARALRRAALAAAIAAASLAVGGSSALGAAGRVGDDDYVSKALRGRVHFAVYLPPDYDTSTRRYPVVYFLHGLPTTKTAYKDISFLADALERGNLSAIIVAPQGARDGDSDPEYLDWRPGRNWATALARELPQVVDARYRTVPTRRGRAIVGLSAGGYGAMLLGINNLDVFGAVESWSGYFHPTDPSGEHSLDLGSPAKNARASAHAAVPELKRKLAKRPSFVGFYVGDADDRFRAENVQLDRELSAVRVPHVFRVYRGGHSFTLWQAQATHWLQLALAHLG